MWRVGVNLDSFFSSSHFFFPVPIRFVNPSVVGAGALPRDWIDHPHLLMGLRTPFMVGQRNTSVVHSWFNEYCSLNPLFLREKTSLKKFGRSPLVNYIYSCVPTGELHIFVEAPPKMILDTNFSHSHTDCHVHRTSWHREFHSISPFISPFKLLFCVLKQNPSFVDSNPNY